MEFVTIFPVWLQQRQKWYSVVCHMYFIHTVLYQETHGNHRAGNSFLLFVRGTVFLLCITSRDMGYAQGWKQASLGSPAHSVSTVCYTKRHRASTCLLIWDAAFRTLKTMPSISFHWRTTDGLLALCKDSALQ